MKPLICNLVVIACLASPIFAETVVAKRTIRAQEILSRADMRLIAETIPGMANDIDAVAGLEARRIIYAGRPVSMNDVGPPALVDRNQIVRLAYRNSGITIRTDGRSLGRGGFGDRVRVINLESRTTVSGKIGQAGVVWVGE